MEIREVQLRAAYDTLYDLRASFDRQIAALRAEIRRVTAADSSYVRFDSKADVNSRHG
jgi:hypothetical protein